MIGAGWQAATQIAGLREVRDLDEVRVYAPTRAKLEAFCAEHDAIPAGSAREAIEGADVVALATNAHEPVLDGTWLEPGQHVGSVQGGELDERTLRRADLVVVRASDPATYHYAPGHAPVEASRDAKAEVDDRRARRGRRGPRRARRRRGDHALHRRRHGRLERAGHPVRRRRATPSTAPPACAASAASSRPSGSAEGEAVKRYGSDVMVDAIKACGFKYVSLNPGSSYRGLHDSLVNYGGNEPEIITCNHEKLAVGIAHGYTKAAREPMACILHDIVGLLQGTMGIYYAWIDRAPVVVFGGAGPMAYDRRRPNIDWIHTANVQGNVVRDYTKWDDQPASVASVAGVGRARLPDRDGGAAGPGLHRARRGPAGGRGRRARSSCRTSTGCGRRRRSGRTPRRCARSPSGSAPPSGR